MRTVPCVPHVAASKIFVNFARKMSPLNELELICLNPALNPGPFFPEGEPNSQGVWTPETPCTLNARAAFDKVKRQVSIFPPAHTSRTILSDSFTTVHVLQY